MVATPVLLDAQAMVRPASTLPAASFAVAVNAWVPPTAMLAVAGVTAIAARGAVVAWLATLESPPKTAFTFNVPRYATSWNWYAVDGASPSTVQVRVAPIAVPAIGTLQVPRVTSLAEPQEMAPAANRTL